MTHHFCFFSVISPFFLAISPFFFVSVGPHTSATDTSFLVFFSVFLQSFFVSVGPQYQISTLERVSFFSFSTFFVEKLSNFQIKTTHFAQVPDEPEMFSTF